MNLTEALHVSADGKIIVSCTGVHYSPEALQAKRLGVAGAVCNSVIKTDVEKKGAWKIYG